MGAESLETESLDHRRPGAERGEGGIGAASGRPVAHGEIFPQLEVDPLRMPGEGARGSGPAAAGGVARIRG